VWSQAMSLLQEMKRRALMPTLDIYTQVLMVLLKSGCQKEAQEFYEEAQAQHLFSVWSKKGHNLNVQELPVEVAEMVVRAAIVERSQSTRKAGKGGFCVLTGPASKSTAFKQKAVLKVMREEYGLKVRVDPAKFGRVTVKADELKRLCIERAVAKGEKVPTR